jgi:hypothetical protein
MHYIVLIRQLRLYSYMDHTKGNSISHYELIREVYCHTAGEYYPI